MSSDRHICLTVQGQQQQSFRAESLSYVVWCGIHDSCIWGNGIVLLEYKRERKREMPSFSWLLPYTLARTHSKRPLLPAWSIGSSVIISFFYSWLYNNYVVLALTSHLAMVRRLRIKMWSWPLIFVDLSLLFTLIGMGDNKVIKAHYSEAERTLSPVLIAPTIHGKELVQ